MGWTPDETVGEYRLLETLGAGGAGAVWRVEHRPTGAQRALKVLLDVDPESIARFAREAQTLARLDHPHVAKVHTAGQAHGRPYLVLDLARGDLAAQLQRGPLEPERTRELMLALCAGLAHVHAHGILHRDLKPSNVLFSKQGRPVLADFGLSRGVDARSLTETGAILGTPGYMAPEQATGGEVDARTDVYGLGGVLYAALTGQPPFRGPSPLQTLHAVVTEPPTPPQVLNPAAPADLVRVCLRALAKAPAERYADVSAFAAALEAEAKPTSPRVLAGVAVASAALALGALGLVYTYVASAPSAALPPPAPPGARAAAPPTNSAAPATPNPLDHRLGALDPVRLEELLNLSWPRFGFGTRQDLLNGTNVAGLRQATERLFGRSEGDRERALVLLYQVGKQGQALDDPELRRETQKAWSQLATRLMTNKTWREAVWDDEAWQREGPEVLLACCHRAIEAGRADGLLELGNYYGTESERQFGIPVQPAWALGCFERVLLHERSTAKLQKRASLLLADLLIRHPELEGGPGVFLALDRAQHWTPADFEDTDVEALREALAATARKAAESALDDAFRELPELTLEDFAGYERLGPFPPPVEQLLTLQNTSGLQDACDWLQKQGSPATAAVLLYQIAHRGLALDPGHRERRVSQRSWTLLGDLLAENKDGLRERIWPDVVWAHVGWHVVHECYHRAAVGGHSGGYVKLGSLYLAKDETLGGAPDPARAQTWLRKLATLEHYDTGDRRRASLYLVEIALDHPDTEGRLSDAEALETVRQLVHELHGNSSSARAVRLQRRLEARLNRQR